MVLLFWVILYSDQYDPKYIFQVGHDSVYKPVFNLEARQYPKIAELSPLLVIVRHFGIRQR